MPETPIRTEPMRELERASEALIARIREAARAFHESPPEGWRQWEEYRTPSPWEDRVLPNLARYHQTLQHAIRACEAGTLEPIVRIASTYAGLSKDLDFSMDWMDPSRREAVDKALDEVVAVADRIRRIGYEAVP